MMMKSLPQLAPQTYYSRQRGASTLTNIVFGALLVAVIYAASQILPFFYYYFELVGHMEEAVRVAPMKTDAELRKMLIYQINWMGIPAAPSDLRIERSEEYIEISLQYSEVFSISFGEKEYDLHTF